MFPIRIANLHFTPGGRPVLDGIDLQLGGDGITVLLGPNGAGKSVLLRLLAGLIAVDRGRIDWADDALPPAGIAMVFQAPMMLRASVLVNVGLGLTAQPLPAAARRQLAGEMLARVGLAHRAADSARLLSGGERQRLALARAWAMKPQLLLLDEPTAALDPTATEAVEAIVREMRTDGTRVIMATHNLGQAMRMADDIVFIDAGRIREHTPSQRFFARPQSEAARLFIQGELPWRITFDN